MQSPYWNVVIRSGSDAIINGMPVEMVVPSNVYSSVFQHLAGIARSWAVRCWPVGWTRLRAGRWRGSR